MSTKIFWLLIWFAYLWVATVFVYLYELRLRKASPEEAPEAASEDSYFGQSEASGDDFKGLPHN